MDTETHLSKYLAKLKAGERIFLCKRNQPVAQITLLPESPRRSRPIGLAKRTFTVSRSFFETIPDDLLDVFEGRRREGSPRYLYLLVD